MHRPVVVLLFVLPCLLRAQLVAPQLKILTMRDGLTSDHVQCMAMDQRGYLWIGTSDGLNRYDGKRVKTYRTGGPVALPSDLITWITAAPDGFLYLGSSAPFLTILDPVADTLINIPLPVPAFSKHGEQRANRIHIDRKKRIWVAHGARCLSMFDPVVRSFATTEIAPPLPSPRSREVVIGIHEDAEGILWLATFKGLVRFDPERMIAEPVRLHAAHGSPGDGYSFQVRGAVDDDSCLVIGTWSEGIFRMRKRDGQVRLLWPSPDHKPTFVDHMVQDMLRVADHAYVATIDMGLLRLDLRSGRVDRYDRSLAEDRCRTSEPLIPGAARLMRMGEALCIGSYSKGLSIWSARSNAVSAAQLPQHDTEEETDEVFAVRRDPISGTLLVCSHRRGVFLYDSKGRQLVQQFHRPDPARRYYRHLPLAGERLLMGSAPHAWIASLRTGEMKRPHFMKEGTPCGGMLWWARGDGAHGLWCFTGAKGLHHVDTLSGRCTALVDTLPELSRKLGTWPLDIFTDRSGRQWFLSATAPPVVLHPDGRSERVEGPPSLAPFEVSSMAQSPDGTLWFAVKHTGLAALEADATTLSAITDRNARLNSRNILDVAAMQDGTLWLALPNALQHFNPASGQCRVITPVDGLPSGPLNLSNDPEPQAHPLAVGTWEGFFTVNKDGLSPLAPPAVQIMQVLALDSAITEGATLTHESNRITILLRSTNLIDAQRDEFSYRLLGADSAWLSAGGEDRITFHSLPPGAYRFEARARTASGPWGDAVTAGFTILPPFWATWWFRASAVAVLLALAWLGFQLVLRARLRKQRAGMERERARLEERIRIAHDLHDDLGSSLASIGMESELAELAANDPAARDALRRVSQGARNVGDNMRRIVWAMSSGQDTLGDLAAYVRGVAGDLLEQHDAMLEVEQRISTPERLLTLAQRKHLTLFCKEALHNVVKHAAAATVMLRFEQEGATLQLTIEDDGCGYDAQATTGMGTGSASMRDRAAILGGDMVVRSAPGCGTTVTLTVPLGEL